jgi:superfamily II DNA/RNA helicase
MRAWNISKVSTLPSVLTRLEYRLNDVQMNRVRSLFLPLPSGSLEKEIILVPSSGIRGLHLPNIDSVLIVDPPRTMDQYLHIAGRTGRIECMDNNHDSNKMNYRVVNVVDELSFIRLQSWKTGLGVQFNLIEHEYTPYIRENRIRQFESSPNSDENHFG